MIPSDEQLAWRAPRLHGRVVAAEQPRVFDNGTSSGSAAACQRRSRARVQSSSYESGRGRNAVRSCIMSETLGPHVHAISEGRAAHLAAVGSARRATACCVTVLP